MADRSQSRGREDLVSTGRGGGGNFVRSDSTSRVRGVADGHERGRDIYTKVEGVTHAGRGGQGNVRSPSRDASKDAADRAYEEEILRQRREQRNNLPVSSGRGGTGNISAEQSRSRSREPRASMDSGLGRGGLGNIEEVRHFPHHRHGDLEKLDEEERTDAIKHQHKSNGVHLHSSGRGGQANMTTYEAYEPNSTKEAPPAPGVVPHAGRGGAGNIQAEA